VVIFEREYEMNEIRKYGMLMVVFDCIEVVGLVWKNN
jgi:hypothetical protein